MRKIRHKAWGRFDDFKAEPTPPGLLHQSLLWTRVEDARPLVSSVDNLLPRRVKLMRVARTHPCLVGQSYLHAHAPTDAKSVVVGYPTFWTGMEDCSTFRQETTGTAYYFLGSPPLCRGVAHPMLATS